MRRAVALSLCLSLVGVALTPRTASACGGFFAAPRAGSTPPVVTGQRWAYSISRTRSVLWAKVVYSGEPTEFAWVLPVKGDAHVELGGDAFFEALETFTATHVTSPPLACSSSGSSGCGCPGSAGDATKSGTLGTGGSKGVDVVRQETVGPYETVTIRSTKPNALGAWLSEHGFPIPPHAVPTLDAYAHEGFDFVAMRLKPGAGVSDMRPVRVVTEGAAASIPLRMITAGAGDRVPITLYVLGEGRYAPRGFTEARVDSKDVVWDWKSSTSDYAERRQKALAAESAVFITGYAAHLEATPTGPYGQRGLQTSDGYVNSFDELYRLRRAAVGTQCSAGPTSGDGGLTNEVCDNPDDLSFALEGSRTRDDVWLTRVDMEVARGSLAQDLVLEPAAQTDVSNQLVAGVSKDAPCPPAGGTRVLGADGRVTTTARSPSQVSAGLALGFLVGATFLRRRRRPV